MASDKSPTTARGLLISDPRIDASSIWSAQSSYTQAGPEPGIPAAQGNYDLNLISRGSQSASKQLRIRGQKAGGVGIRGNAGVVWKNEGDTNYRGKDSMGVITHWESITWIDGSGDPASTADPFVLSLADGSTLVAYTATSAGGNYEVHTRSRSAAGTWGSAVVVYSTGTAPSSAISSSFHPCLIQLPDARVVLFCKLEESDTCQIQVYESTDSGANWTGQNRRALPSGIDVSSGSSGWVVREPVAAYQNGQVLLLINAVINDTHSATTGREYRQALWQYASDSGGLDFSAIREPTSRADDRLLTSSNSSAPPSRFLAGSPVLQAHAGFFWLFYVTYHQPGSATVVSQADYLSVDRLASAFRHIQTADNVASIDIDDRLGTISSTNGATTGDSNRHITESDIAASIADDGTMYVLARILDETQQIILIQSSDLGQTWQSVGANAEIADSAYDRGIVFASGDSATYLKNLSMTNCQGRLLVVSNMSADPGNEDNSVVATYLGGWSTVTTPPLYTYSDGTEMGGYNVNWLPIDGPGSVAGWTAATSGSKTITLNNGLILTSVSGGNVYYHRAPSSTTAQGLLARWALKCVHGDSGSAEVGCVFRVADSSHDSKLEIRYTATGFTVIDANDSGTEGAVSIDMTTAREFYLSITGGATPAYRLYYRTHDSSSDREWTKFNSGAAATLAAGSQTSNLVQWGHIAAQTGPTANSSTWYEFHLGYGAQTGLGPTSIDTNPDELQPGRIGAGIAQTYIDDGVSLSATAGPARVGDTFNIDTRYTYPIERVFHSESPSPRVKWRSTSTAEHTIALQLDSITTESSLAGNDVIGIALLAPNFRNCTLEGYNTSSTAWETIATIDASSGMTSLGFARKAGSVAPSSGSSNTFYLHTNELAGGWMGLNAGTIRKIKANTDGQWAGSLTRKLPTVIIEGATTSDLASGSAGYFIPPTVVAVAKLNGSIYGGYRLKIPSQSAGGGSYFELGGLIVGWVEYFSRQNSWGRIVSETANTELTRQLDGTVTSKVYGPSYRTVRFAWTDGVDVTQVEGDSVSPDYILNSADGSAKPVGSPAETPYLMQGLVSMLNPDGGASRAVVYLPSIPKSGNTIILNRKNESIAGRVTSPVQLENIQGDENADEVFRVASVTIEESV